LMILALLIAGLVFALFYYGSLPGFYHIRLFYYIWLASRLPKLQRFNEPSSLSFRCMLDDLDFNLHLNNTRYGIYADFGRYHHLFQIKGMREAARRYHIVYGGLLLGFISQITFLQPFTVTTRIQYFDNKWFFLAHAFTNSAGKLVGYCMSKLLFKMSGKTIPPAEVLRQLGLAASDDDVKAMLAENHAGVQMASAHDAVVGRL